MKFTQTCGALALAAMATFTQAKLELTSHPDGLDVGKKYWITWTTDQPYIAKLFLVQKTNDMEGWTPVQDLFANRPLYLGEGSGDQSYLWTVPNMAPENEYALWLDGMEYSNVTDPKSAAGYSDLTPWFEIHGGKSGELSRAQIAGVVVGMLAVVSCGGLIFWLVRRRRASRKVGELPSAQNAGWRDSVDTIMVEKEKARLNMGEVNA